MIIAAISLVIGSMIGFTVSIIYHKKKVKGVLRIDKSDPDGPYLFLELASDPAILEKQNKEIQKNNEKILWTLENMQYIENEKEVQEMKNKYHDLLRAEFVVIASIFNK